MNHDYTFHIYTFGPGEGIWIMDDLGQLVEIFNAGAGPQYVDFLISGSPFQPF